MREIHTSLEIEAPASEVWEVLTRFREYDEWNPMITRMKATLSSGEPLSFYVALDGRDVPIRARMLNVEPGRELRWRGPRSRALGALFSGEHYLRVEPAGAERSVFHHGEAFSGLTVPMLWRSLEPKLLAAYGGMNQALKKRVEARRGNQGPGPA